MNARILAIMALFAAAGCTTPPAEYASSLSPQDPKWLSPECEETRMAALRYDLEEKKPMSLPVGLMLGPYGLGIALASREHQDMKRKLFAREMHLRCSSLPLPENLRVVPSSTPVDAGQGRQSGR
ncbi:MAG: hypothetical protein K5872_20770 [Rhizobiaceae bacterium]|nr:hypothetical protein [Rhizobiaceae bacterium]MCV0408652.1 hypothetical protein [Rhizobiaceae bacterium]